MSDQVINTDGDIIEDVQDDNWQDGKCNNKWVELTTHTEAYSETYS